MGHLLISHGLKPDPAKVSAILDMPEPADIAAVRRFIGTVNYLGKYLPRLSRVAKPVTSLTCKDHAWTWGPTHKKDVDTIKQLIPDAPHLRHYDPAEKLVIQFEASKDGLRACMLQQGQPITYANWMMTAAEQIMLKSKRKTWQSFSRWKDFTNTPMDKPL